MLVSSVLVPSEDVARHVSVVATCAELPCTLD
jgi:hypothetical protein